MLRTLWIQKPAFVGQCHFLRSWFFSVPGHTTNRTCGIGIFESRTKTFALCKFLSATMQATWSLQILLRSLFKRLVLGTTIWQHAKMITVLKSPKGLKDSECKKRQLSSCTPLPYVPPTDLVTTKKSLDNLKIKLPNGTIFNMTIFSHRQHQGIPCPCCCCPASHPSERTWCAV